METKKTVVERYGKELEEIEEQLELLKAGEVWDFEIMNRIKILTTSAYYDGKSDGIETGRQIFSH